MSLPPPISNLSPGTIRYPPYCSASQNTRRMKKNPSKHNKTKRTLKESCSARVPFNNIQGRLSQYLHVIPSVPQNIWRKWGEMKRAENNETTLVLWRPWTLPRPVFVSAPELSNTLTPNPDCLPALTARRTRSLSRGA